jgi:hypothetical protein
MADVKAVDAEGPHEVRASGDRREKGRRSPSDDRGRVRRKREHGRGEPLRPRVGHGLVEDRLVSAVDTVEVSDDERAR